MLPLIAASMFGFVFLTLLTVTRLVQTRRAVRRRAIAFNPAFAGAGGHSFEANSPRSASADQASELLFTVEKGLSESSNGRLSRTRRELIRAGFFRKDAVFWYYVIRVAMACVLATTACALLLRFFPSASAGVMVGLTLVGAAGGLLIPSAILS